MSSSKSNRKQSSDSDGGGTWGRGRKGKKKSKEGGGVGGLTSLLGALHEETNRSNIFSEELDMGMMETYSQSARPPSSTGSVESGTTTPSNTEEINHVFIGGDSDVSNNNKMAMAVSARESTIQQNGISRSENIPDLNNNSDVDRVSNNTVQKDEEGFVNGQMRSNPDNDGNKNKTRQLVKVSLQSKNLFSGKEYIF